MNSDSIRRGGATPWNYYTEQRQEYGDSEELEFLPEGDGDEATSDSFTSASSRSSSSFVPWISEFCSRPENLFFVPVPEDFIEDDFNLTGLSTLVPFYNESLDIILDLEPEFSDSEKYEQLPLIENSAEQLYGLIHQRFILTKVGITMMREKYESLEFGKCPRELCRECGVVPCGISDFLNIATVKMYCPRCGDLYHPRKSRFQNIDGACFGTTFPHMMFMTNPELVPPITVSTGDKKLRRKMLEYEEEASDVEADETESDEDEEERDEDYDIYVPKIFGFRINIRSKAAPRMQWLRWKEGMDVELVLGKEVFKNDGESEMESEANE